jgi:uncharacterized protein (UPF0210 family)
MFEHVSRRDFIGMVGAGLAWPLAAQERLRVGHGFRIRTITAGVRLESATDLRGVDSAIGFLRQAKQAFVERGYEVQTVRIATEPLAEYLPSWNGESAIEALRTLDRRAVDADVSFSVGPVITADEQVPDFGRWAADLVRATRNVSFSAHVASPARGVHHEAARSAAEAIAAIARATSGGEGNFRFAATAFCPPGTPFFPAAYHAGEPAFSLGLESPPLLRTAFEGSHGFTEAKTALRTRMGRALAPIETLAEEISRTTGRRYLGIDVSPAPGLDASIGEAIETLTGVPFGAPSTLAACAAITEVLKTLEVRTCGYSGLMLPVLEDPVLARRATEGRYGVSELLLYSSVCGTGLDVVPIPGDTSVRDLAATIADVAALATRYQKPLSARLFPAPGKRAGEAVHFDDPHLTDAVVMPLGARQPAQ